MIPCVDTPEVISSGEPLIRIDMMRMDPEDMKVMIENSRDGFYSNKELAPIREYSTNARDAHIRKGIGATPIQVTLPTEMEPVLKVRDFGAGLTLEQITDVYFRYWKSTKRNNNDENGCLGIGAKSAFAYTAIYTVTTWCEGMKTVATGQKNGFADVIYRGENTENEPEGVEISIPVLQKDIEKFTLEAMNLFKYWDVRPTFINVDESTLKEHFTSMDTVPFLCGEGWEIRPAGYGCGESVAVMSNVAYKIDWHQIRNGIDKGVLSKVQGIFEFLEENITTFRFKNGTLAFTPNRESLQYNEPTMKAMTELIVAIYDKLLTMITDKIGEATNIWDAKIIFNSIFRKDLDGFDKGMLYGGNLASIEQLVKHRIIWNGINITSGLFNNLHLWDKDFGQRGFYEKSSTQIFQTYVKEDGNIKSCRCNAKRNNKMYASPKSLVIIQDTKKARLAKAAAEYYLLKSGKDISQVYVLNLSVPSVHDAFMKAYSFDSVPAIRISQVEDTIVAYIKSSRTFGGGGGGTGGISTPIHCPSIDVKNLRQKDGSINYIEWNRESTTPKGLSGGIYVQYQKQYAKGGCAVIYGDIVGQNQMNYYIQSLWELCNEHGITVDKVYGIHQRTVDSVWFNKAKDDGQWIELTDFIKQNVNKLDQDVVKKIMAYNSCDDSQKIGTYTANQLLPLLEVENESAYVYCKTLVEEIKEKAHIADILSWYRIKVDCSEYTKYFTNLIKDIKNKYPMLFCHQNQRAISNDSISGYYSLNKNDVAMVANYINLVDKSA